MWVVSGFVLACAMSRSEAVVASSHAQHGSSKVRAETQHFEVPATGLPWSLRAPTRVEHLLHGPTGPSAQQAVAESHTPHHTSSAAAEVGLLDLTRGVETTKTNGKPIVLLTPEQEWDTAESLTVTLPGMSAGVRAKREDVVNPRTQQPFSPLVRATGVPAQQHAHTGGHKALDFQLQGDQLFMGGVQMPGRKEPRQPPAHVTRGTALPRGTAMPKQKQVWGAGKPVVVDWVDRTGLESGRVQLRATSSQTIEELRSAVLAQLRSEAPELASRELGTGCALFPMSGSQLWTTMGRDHSPYKPFLGRAMAKAQEDTVRTMPPGMSVGGGLRGSVQTALLGGKAVPGLGGHELIESYVARWQEEPQHRASFTAVIY